MDSLHRTVAVNQAVTVVQTVAGLLRLMAVERLHEDEPQVREIVDAASHPSSAWPRGTVGGTPKALATGGRPSTRSSQLPQDTP